MHTGFWWGSLTEEDHLEDSGAVGYNIKMVLREVGWWARSGSIWLMVGTDGGC